jgi:ligand-binding SRPBCC domain-containing protein
MGQLQTELWLPRKREEVFRFFSDAGNLEVITPPWLRFTVLTPRPIEMRVGTRIDYQLKVRGIPLRWQSEITAWEPPVRFVDEQRRGPYRKWRHEHLFEEHGDRTLAIDRVDYDVFAGFIVESLFVRRDVEQIFAFRKTKLLEIFPATT